MREHAFFNAYICSCGSRNQLAYHMQLRACG